MMKRREFLQTATAVAALGSVLEARQAQPATPVRPSTLGVVQYSFSPNPNTGSAAAFLDYCHSLGAGGVQIGLGMVTDQALDDLRRHAEQLGMYLEAIVTLPQKDHVDAFEHQVAAAKRAGASCMRAACLSGRRYEDFSSLVQWKQFVELSRQRLQLALPVVQRNQLALGIENHKDWTADELADLIRHYSSEYLGVCLDTGNNVALLDDPMGVIRTLAPFAVTTHFKDVAVQEYSDGFQVSEVALGNGILDLQEVVKMVSQHRPGAHFNLEMITRDPLKIPCLTTKYWETFPDRGGMYVARAMTMVRNHKPAHPLQVVTSLAPAARQKLEVANVVQSIAYARDRLGMVHS